MRTSSGLEGYPALVDMVRGSGQCVVGRGGETREVIALTVCADPGELVHRSRINHRIGWVELLQLIVGIHDPGAIARAAPNSNRRLFTDQMAYGPRVAGRMRDGDGEAHASVDQLDRIVDELGARASSRQAVLYVGRPWETCTDGLPCTSTIQFLRRLDGLHCVVSMRSWDLILGLPYDLMMFGGLQQVVAGCLGESLGDLIVTAGSAHVYLPAGAAYEIHECDQRFRLPIEGRLVDYRAWVADALLGDWVETPGGTPPEVTIERLGAPTPV